MRIAQQLSHIFGLGIDKDVVRRVLARHYPTADPRTIGTHARIRFFMPVSGPRSMHRYRYMPTN